MADKKRGKKVEDGIWENLNAKGEHDGTYCVAISRRFKIDKGPRRSKQLFMRRRRIESLFKARKEKRKLEDLMAAKAIKMADGDKTWKEAYQEYLTWIYQRMDDRTMSPTTVENIRLTLNKHTERWNSKMMSWFNISVFEEFLNEAALKAETSYVTRKAILKYIRQVFKLQIARGFLNHNPTNGVHIRRGVGETVYAEREPRVMRKEDFEKVLAWTKQNEPDWAKVFEFSFNSGLRSGEAFSLVWKNVVFPQNKERGYLIVKTSYDWKSERILPTTKGKKDRIVPMNRKLETLLRALKLESSSDFVLPRLDDWRNGKAAETLRNIQRAVEIPYTTNFHALRGSFCTALLLRGVAPIKVQRIMGHASFKTTEYYCKLVGLDLEGATDVLDIDETEATVIPIKKKAD